MLKSELRNPRWGRKLYLAAAVGMAVSACGGGGGSSSTSSTGESPASVIAGVASKGPLNGATVCAYALANGTKGAQLGCARTDESGNYSLSVAGHTGDVLVEASGGTYVDEATGQTVNLSGPLRSFARNLEPGFGKAVAVTPLTEIATSLAEQAGGLNADNLDLAASSVQSNFGVDDIVTTQPTDVLGSGASAAGVKAKAYGLALAAFAQHMNNQGTSATVSAVVAEIRDDIRAGTFGSDSGQALANARDVFVRSVRNRTGETQVTVNAILPIGVGSSTAAGSSGGGSSTTTTTGYGTLAMAGGVAAGSQFDPDTAYPEQASGTNTNLNWLDGSDNNLALSFVTATNALNSLAFGTGWRCTGGCGGAVTVTPSSRTVVFNNASLASLTGGTALTLTGTLTY